MSKSSQKFIARNRAPRVQIEYDVELYGAETKVQLPFIMGVMANLSGKPAEALPDVADRKFLEVDIDNFDQRLKAMKPRAAFQVPNTLTGDGNLMIDLNPSNVKLRDRAVRIVSELTGVSPEKARAALEESEWVVKTAVQALEKAKS